LRLKKKILNLVDDLVINDDGIYEEHPYHVRQYFCNDQAFLAQLTSIIASADLASMQELQYRDSIFRVLFRLHQFKPEIVAPVALSTLIQHKAAL